MGTARRLRLRYTPLALDELDTILEYIRIHSPSGATKVAARLKELIAILPDFPYSGRATTEPALRVITATPYPYLIFYEVSEQDVVIVGFRHSAQNPETFPGH